VPALRRLSRHAAALAATISIAAAATACGSNDRPAGLHLDRLGSFDAPTFVTSAPGVRRAIYVVERGGTVVAIDGRRRHTFLDLSRRTTTDGERGLLSIAFDPQFHRDGLVYACYTNPAGDIEVDSFEASARSARAGSRRTVIVVPHPGQSNHNGGQIQFGPDGDLYLGTGDGGSEGDPLRNGQSVHTLLGKILRIIPRRHGPDRYAIPRGNPYLGRPGRDEIAALGFRNPWRFAFDRPTGRILIGDVGQSRWEEVNYETHRALIGGNFGWRRFEGRHIYDPSTPAPANYRPPVFEYSHDRGCAIVGGVIVRDPSLGGLAGRYLYADLCSGQLRSLAPRLGRARDDRPLGLRVADPSSFGVAHGRVYIASLDGPVYRLAR
jgi:glucose/arabinose dehydrogenase